MDVLKGLSTPLLAMGVGVVVTILGLSDKFELGPLKYSSNPSLLARIGLVCLGTAVALFGLITWLVGERRKVDSASHADVSAKTENVAAEDFFATLDEVPSFQDIAADCSRIEILSRTGVNILGNYARTLASLCQAGCEVRLIYVDPESPSALSLYGSEYETYMNNLEAARHQLERLMQTIGPRLSVKTTKHSPPFSLIHFVSNDRKKSSFRVQLNFMHSRVARDRPVFSVQHTDKWYQAFNEEFESTWNESKPYGAPLDS